MKITVLDFGSVDKGDLSTAALETLGEVKIYDAIPAEKLVSTIGESEILLCNKAPITRAVIEKCPQLRYIGVMATGFNNICLPACRERGITVCNIPGYSTDAVAQQTFAFILQFATSLCSYTASTARGEWIASHTFSYAPYPMTELSGKTLGIYGLGTIGKKVASIGTAFGMRILYHSRTEKDVPYEYVTTEELFSQSDFLTFHAALTPETENLVNEESLALMKKSAFLINTSRGGVIDEKALAAALTAGRIAGFAADVLTVEPQRADSPLQGLSNCFLTPHVAWAPFETRQRLFGILCANLEGFLQGRIQNAV